MSSPVSRRKFLQSSTLAAAGITAAAVSPFASPFEQNEKSIVALVKDENSMHGETPDATVIQNMVDTAVKRMTGISETSKAYEALFPTLTAATKIVLKRNDISGRMSPSNPTVVDCLKNGLLTMLDGALPEENISIVMNRNMSSSSVMFTFDGTSGPFQQVFVDADWIINCPVCWAHGSRYAVTLSHKNMMSCVYSEPLTVRPWLHSGPIEWLGELNSHPVLRDKQVMVLMDAICGRYRAGPGGSVDYLAHTLIASKDMVAADYQALQILAAEGMDTTRQQRANEILDMVANAPYNLGTNDPSNMEIVDGATDLKKSNSPKHNAVKVKTVVSGGRVTFLLPVRVKSAEIVISDARGRQIYYNIIKSTGTFEWNAVSNDTKVIRSGLYFYRIKTGASVTGGHFSLVK